MRMEEQGHQRDAGKNKKTLYETVLCLFVNIIATKMSRQMQRFPCFGMP